MDVKESRMELIKKFIETCPLLSNGKIAVDYLDEDIDSYSINQVTANPIFQPYQDGTSIRQIIFDFTVVEPFSKVENLINSKFCEDFMDWIEEQNNNENLPDIEGADEIVCTGPGKIIQRNETLAVYAIPMRFTYLK